MRPRIIAVGQLPPPVTGYAYITARMIETLGQNANVETINTSPGEKKGFAKHIRKSQGALRACWRILRNGSHPRLMYMGCEGDWGLIYTLMLTFVGSSLGYTIFLHHHSFSYVDRTSRLMQWITKAGGDHIHHIFLCSKMWERFEHAYGKLANARIISNAAFVEGNTEAEIRTHSGPLKLGLLSNLTREKGLYTFIELLRQLRRSGIEVIGHLAGPIMHEGDTAIVQSAVSELNGSLRYIGPVYGEAKRHFYREIDVFVFPSEYPNEAQPTVLFEALAAGNMIVAFDRGCIGNQIGSNGLVVPVGSDFCAQVRDQFASIMEVKANISAERDSIRRNFAEMQSAALSSVSNLLSSTREPTKPFDFECS